MKKVQVSDAIAPPLKSAFYDYQKEQEGLEKNTSLLLQRAVKNKSEESALNKENEITRGYEPCLDTSICSQDVQDSPKQPSNLGEYRQLSLLKSTPMHSEYCDRTSQTSPSIQTSETTKPNQENSTSLQWDSPVQEQATQELEQDLLIQPQLCGKKVYELSRRLNPNSWWLNNQQEFSIEDYELFLEDSEWQNIVSRLKLSQQQDSEQVKEENACLLFPTLTSGQTSTKMRPAGQVRCEKWFKDNGLILNGSQLASQAIAMIMGFPPNWFDCLSQVKPQEESEQDISQVEQLHQPKHRSLSAESSISIPCLVKQPKQPEVRGVISQDEGDRFLVDVGDKTISVSKLFVYPNFEKCSSKAKSAKPKRKVLDTSDKCSSKIIPPSTNCSSKTRRLKGEGSGHVYYRTVTRNGKDYRQAYYQWRENGKQRTKYIPKKLLTKVEEAESSKLPIADVLVLLGGMDKCSSKSSNTSIAPIDDEVMNVSNECSSKIIPPSKSRRTKGKGSGWIECKPIKRGGNEYKQYWYHYEEWRSGDRITKKSRYIPKRLVARVEKMEAEKVSVSRILELLISKKRSRK